jgi:hypothetical protein
VLAREHARLFPDGFVLHLGRPTPAAFAALSPDVRQAIWRDAIRRATGARRRPSAASPAWRVTALAPQGALTHVFVRKVLRSPDEQAWTERIQPLAWRVGTSVGRRRS